MMMRRALLVSASTTLGVIFLSTPAIAQTGGVFPHVPPAPAAEQHWAAVQCAACQKAGIIVEFRQVPNDEHHPNTFTIARVRNISNKEVAGSLDVMEDDLPDSEGHVRSQTIWFVLGAAGSDPGDHVVLLRRSTPVKVIVNDVSAR